MLAELHPRLAVNPLSLRQSRRPSTSQSPPSPAHTGKHQRPGNGTEAILLRLHRRLVARFTDPPGILLVPGPGLPLGSKLLHIRRTFLPAHRAHRLRLRLFKRFVVPGPDGPVMFCGRWCCLRHFCVMFAADAASNRSALRCDIW